MKKLILISHCTRVKKSYPVKFYFHFNGVYMGNRVNRVLLSSKRDLRINKNDELLLYINFLEVKDYLLIGEIIQYKHLKELNLF